MNSVRCKTLNGNKVQSVIGNCWKKKNMIYQKKLIVSESEISNLKACISLSIISTSFLIQAKDKHDDVSKKEIHCMVFCVKLLNEENINCTIIIKIKTNALFCFDIRTFGIINRTTNIKHTQIPIG